MTLDRFDVGLFGRWTCARWHYKLGSTEKKTWGILCKIPKCLRHILKCFFTLISVQCNARRLKNWPTCDVCFQNMINIKRYRLHDSGISLWVFHLMSSFRFKAFGIDSTVDLVPAGEMSLPALARNSFVIALLSSYYKVIGFSLLKHRSNKRPIFTYWQVFPIILIFTKYKTYAYQMISAG